MFVVVVFIDMMIQISFMVNWMLKFEQAEAAKAMSIFRAWANDPLSTNNRNWTKQLSYRCYARRFGFLQDFDRYYAVWTAYKEILERVKCCSVCHAEKRSTQELFRRDWSIFDGD